MLAQFVLKIGFALAKKGGIGEVGGLIQNMSCTRQLPWLPVEQPWLALAGPFLTLLTQMGTENHSFPLVGAPFPDL